MSEEKRTESSQNDKKYLQRRRKFGNVTKTMYNNENSYCAAEPECLVSLREITATVSTILAVSCRWRLFEKEFNLHLKFCFECTLVFVFILL